MIGIAVWGDFEVDFERVLGRGGMGTVFLARQRSLNRRVAIKVLDTSRAPDPELVQGFLQKFQVEIHALSCLNDPRIVTILQAGENDGRVWFAMELIEGKTLEQKLEEDGAFEPREAARIASEVARALETAHRRGIVHRDVKPANIFVGADGTVKLADFGLARSDAFSSTRLTDVNAVACTPAYAAPETAGGRSTDFRSDLYSLGCVLYEMVTERPPFTDDSPVATLFRHSSEDPVAPRLLNPAVSEKLEKAILRCLRKDPSERYGSYADLVRDLEPRAAEPAPGLWPWAAAAGAALFGVILTAVLTNVPSAPIPDPPPVAILKPAAPEPVPQLKEVEPEIAVLAEGTEPPYAPVAAELEALDRLFALSRSTLAARSEGRFDEARRRLDEFEAVTPWVSGFVEAERERFQARGDDPLARSAAGQALAVLARVPERHVPAVADQAIEEALRAAEAGDFQPLLSIDVPESAHPFLGGRLRLLGTERSAAELRSRDLVRLLTEFADTRAARRAVREIFRGFAPPDDPDLELVGEVPFGSWVPDGGRPRYEHASKAYVLAGGWITREFKGARQGYCVRFRFGLPGQPVLAVALSSARWFTVSARGATLYRKDGDAAPKAVRSAEFAEVTGGTITVVPREGLVAVYLGDDLLWALPEEDYGLDGGMKVGAGAGTVILDSIRVKDRAR